MPTPDATFVPPLQLLRDDGWSTLFDDLDHLAHACRAWRIEFGPSHAGWAWAWGEDGFYRNHDASWTPSSTWIVRDAMGRTVRMRNLPERRCVRPVTPQERGQVAGAPVPRTGKKRWRFSRHYRRPRHIGVAAAMCAQAVEDKRAGTCRVGGKKTVPPNPWDDIHRACNMNRSWKEFRRTRWKPVS